LDRPDAQRKQGGIARGCRSFPLPVLSESEASALVEKEPSGEQSQARLVITRLDETRRRYVAPSVQVERERPRLQAEADEFFERPFLVEPAAVVDEDHENRPREHHGETTYGRAL